MGRHLSILFLLVASLSAVAQTAAQGQQNFIRPGVNLVLENIPPIPAAIADKANQYGEFRGAVILDWHPSHREMLISTRFADVPQIHVVRTPGGARTQLTFFPDRTGGAHYGPDGSYFVFSKDVGGGAWFQYYRYEVADARIRVLTDGKSRNTRLHFADGENRFAYSSTRRTGRDTDIWMMDARDSVTDHMVLQLEGGGWGVLDWSPDNKKLLLEQGLSANQSYLWLADVASGEKKLLTPKTGDDEIAYGRSRFSQDGKGIYITTDRDSEFQRLRYFFICADRSTAPNT